MPSSETRSPQVPPWARKWAARACSKWASVSGSAAIFPACRRCLEEILWAFSQSSALV